MTPQGMEGVQVNDKSLYICMLLMCSLAVFICSIFELKCFMSQTAANHRKGLAYLQIKSMMYSNIKSNSNILEGTLIKD